MIESIICFADAYLDRMCFFDLNIVTRELLWVSNDFIKFYLLVFFLLFRIYKSILNSSVQPLNIGFEGEQDFYYWIWSYLPKYSILGLNTLMLLFLLVFAFLRCSLIVAKFEAVEYDEDIPI